MTARVPAPDARARRVVLEEGLRPRWRRLCDPERTGVPLTELAEHHLGISRADLYESFEGGGHGRHPRAAWLELLPAGAELVHLRERAHVHGYDLAAAATTHATLADVVVRAGDVLSALASSEADGFISPAEAFTDIAAIERLEMMLARAKAARREAVAKRGLKVAGGASR